MFWTFSIAPYIIILYYHDDHNDLTFNLPEEHVIHDSNNCHRKFLIQLSLLQYTDVEASFLSPAVLNST